MTMEFMKLFRRKQVEPSSSPPSPESPELEKMRQLVLENAQKAEALAVEYKKAKEEAELANRFKSDFLANMSHELRTPLNAMLGYSEMMLEDAEEAGLKTYSENLEKVIYSGKHLLGLINDILDLSKIETGTMKFYVEEYNLKKLIAELDDFIKPLLVKNNNAFKVNIKTDVEIIHTDISRIRQALFNLLDNANKFTKQGKITLDITSSGSWIRFDVIDTGAHGSVVLHVAYAHLEPTGTDGYLLNHQHPPWSRVLQASLQRLLVVTRTRVVHLSTSSEFLSWCSGDRRCQ